MPTKTDHDERRERIVIAACRVLSSSGLEGLSMRRIAAAADCTTGMVTHYFSSKRELVGAALDSVRQVHDERARVRFAADPSDPVEAFGELLPLDEERAQAMRVWLGFYAAAVADDGLRHQHVRIYTRWRTELSAALAELGAPGGEAREQTVDHLIVALNGLVVQALLDPDYWTPKRQRAELTRLVTEAFPPSGPQSSGLR